MGTHTIRGGDLRQWRCACGVGIAPNHTTNLDVRHMVVGLNKGQLLAPSLRGVLCVALPPSISP